MPGQATRLVWTRTETGRYRATVDAVRHYEIVPESGQWWASEHRVDRDLRAQGVGEYETLGRAKAACESHRAAA